MEPLALEDVIQLEEGNPLNGCDLCNFGIVDMPDLWNSGVPYYVARAMSLNMDGLCYTLYCDCRAGQLAIKYDQRTRAQMDSIESVGVSGKQGWMTWTDGSPVDHIPGVWWARVRKKCEEHAGMGIG